MDELIESPLLDYLYKKADHEGIPISGTFELTPQCNMNCKMCYVRLTKDEMEKRGRLRTAKEWIDLAYRVKEKGMLFLLLTGGEPFLRPDFKTIYEEIRQMGIVLSINSNGTMLDENMVEWLSVRKPARMNITLYGASENTYAKLCGNRDAYWKVMDGLKRLKEADIPVKLNCSLTPYNVHDKDAIQKFAKDNGYVIQTATYMFPPIRKNETLTGQNFRFTAEETAKVTTELEIMRNGREVYLDHIAGLKKGHMTHLEQMDCFMDGERMKCKAGTCTFWVTWDGKMLPCGLMSRPETYPFEDGFEYSWEKIKKEVYKIRLPKECANCSYKSKCHTCAAMILAETGGYDIKPQYRCDIMETYMSIGEAKLKEARWNEE